MTPPALDVRAVTKRFGDLAAVDDVSLSVPPGEIFGLLGPNGAGKTTLISCVAGLSRQTSGAIEVFGHDTLRDPRTTRRLVGLVPQEINFDPFFTPRESLLIQMGFMGVRPDSAKVDRILARMSLSDHRDAYTRALSGGMKRRLLVAKALVHDPRLLFLDEPTAGVDVELRRDLWDEVRRLRDRGTTVILTTHYLEEAQELADRIGVIHRGRIVLLADRAELMRAHRQSKAFVELARPISSLPRGLPPGSELLSPTRVMAPWKAPQELTAILEVLSTANALEDLRVEHTRLEDIFVDIVHSAGDGRDDGIAGR